MSALIRKWELDDFEASEFVYDGGYSQEDAEPDWKARYDEAIVAGDYTAARYAKKQMSEV